MRYLNKQEERECKKFFDEMISVAKNSTCKNSKCGSIIVKNGEIIGRGFNGLPNGDENQRRCFCSKESYNKKVTDKTCCVHAEQRAIINALRKNPDKLTGSRLYFIRLDDNNNPIFAGEPYCTICSKMALDIGISEFVLWKEKGFCVYDTGEYNSLSFEFGKAIQ
jgi:deoxycytidylate deaminase